MENPNIPIMGSQSWCTAQARILTLGLSESRATPEIMEDQRLYRLCKGFIDG